MENKNPIYSIASLAASAKKRLGVFDLRLARTLVVTAKCAYNASGTLPLRINLYYTPNNINWDTVPYTWYDVTLTANQVCQRTALIDPPEAGLMAIEIENRDASYAITDISVWSNCEFWPKVEK